MSAPRVTAIAAPLAVFPENAERREALAEARRAATGLDEAVLERLVRAFYARARTDPQLGPLFDDVGDWEAHIARITDFWSSVALMSGRYHGQPMVAHLKLPIEPRHFARWLALFEVTARETCSAAAVDLLMDRAHRIARSLAMGLEIARGAPPPRAA